MECFKLIRNRDLSGISGTGYVAEVVKFANGKVSVAFCVQDINVPSVTTYDCLEDVMRIHGHNGTTRLVKLR